MLIVVGGLLMLINDSRSYLWSLGVILLGALFQLRELGVTDLNPWQVLWPAVIIILGVSVLLSRSGGSQVVSTDKRDDATAILGGIDQKNTSEDYQGGKVIALLGGAKIDLRKAVIKSEATINIFSFWGGVEIVVPRNLIIKNRTNAVVGGIEDKTDQEITKNSPVLHISGDVIMAGVEIKN